MSEMDIMENESYRQGLQRAKLICEIRACREKETNELEWDFQIRRREARTLAELIKKEIAVSMANAEVSE
jgi:hypothetical protein